MRPKRPLSAEIRESIDFAEKAREITPTGQSVNVEMISMTERR